MAQTLCCPDMLFPSSIPSGHRNLVRIIPPEMEVPNVSVLCVRPALSCIRDIRIAENYLDLSED
jgi:hypothetical protein